MIVSPMQYLRMLTNSADRGRTGGRLRRVAGAAAEPDGAARLDGGGAPDADMGGVLRRARGRVLLRPHRAAPAACGRDALAWVGQPALARRVRHRRRIDERDRHMAEPRRIPVGARSRCCGAHDRWRDRRLAVRGDLHVPCDAAGRDCITAGGSPPQCLGSSLVVSLAGPLYLRGAGDPTPPPRTPVAAQLAPAQSSARVQMILLDGASLDFIAPNAAGGRFPNFGRLLDSGAVMHLATLRPTQPAPVWTAVATGKLPYKTSVYSAATLRRAGIRSAARSASRFLFCAGARAFRIDRRGRARIRRGARAADLGVVERLRHHCGCHRLAADVSRAWRQRLPHQRRVFPS